MGCPVTLLGIATDCPDIGGVKAIYIADSLDVSTITVTGSTVTAITMVSGKTFKTFQVKKQVAAMNSTINNDDATGTLYVSTELTLAFNKMSALKRTEITSLSLGDLKVIVKDNNDNHWLMGYDYPATLTAGGASTGAAFGDANQFTVTLTSLSKQLPYAVATGIVSALIA
jgi:hypothetical protein